MSGQRSIFYLVSIILLLIGLATGRPTFLLVALLVGIIFFVMFIWVWLSITHLEIYRFTPTPRSQVGRRFIEKFTAKNRSFLPKIGVEIYDHSTLYARTEARIIPFLMGRKSEQWSPHDSVCYRRGEFELGPMSITAKDPLGLFTFTRKINKTQRVIVYPYTVPIESFKLPAGVLSGGEAQRTITQNITTNAVSIRDYVAGDSINKIHWKSTAKRNKLTVKEFELDPLVDIWLFTDFAIPATPYHDDIPYLPHRGYIPPSMEEYIAIISASLATHFIEQKRSLGYCAYTPHHDVFSPERGQRQLTRILESLAIAKADSKTSLHQMLASDGHRLPRGTTLIIVTSSQETAWVQELSILIQRGIRPVCIYIDPASFGVQANSTTLQQLQSTPSLLLHVIRLKDDLPSALSTGKK